MVAGIGFISDGSSAASGAVTSPHVPSMTGYTKGQLVIYALNIFCTGTMTVTDSTTNLTPIVSEQITSGSTITYVYMGMATGATGGSLSFALTGSSSSYTEVYAHATNVNPISPLVQKNKSTGNSTSLAALTRPTNALFGVFGAASGTVVKPTAWTSVDATNAVLRVADLLSTSDTAPTSTGGTSPVILAYEVSIVYPTSYGTAAPPGSLALMGMGV